MSQQDSQTSERLPVSAGLLLVDSPAHGEPFSGFYFHGAAFCGDFGWIGFG